MKDPANGMIMSKVLVHSEAERYTRQTLPCYLQPCGCNRKLWVATGIVNYSWLI